MESMGRSNCAFVTVLCGIDEGSVMAAEALAKSLVKANTKHPLVVMVRPHLPSVLLERLQSQGCVVEEIVPLFSESDPTFHKFDHSKIHIWKLAAYEKMVYLDPGMLVLANIDNLFDLPNGRIYAVMDCLCKKPGMVLCPYNVGIHPDLVPGAGTYFNDNMLVFEPDMAVHDGLLNALPVNNSASFAEQHFLNKFFAKKWEPLPGCYNYDLEMMALHPETETDHVNARVVHFRAAESKPWGPFGMHLKQWWDILGDETLDFHRPQNLESLMERITEASPEDADGSAIPHVPPAA